MAEENVEFNQEAVSGDVPDGWTAEWVAIPTMLTPDIVVERPFKLVTIMPGGATVTLGSEKEAKDVE